MIQLIPFGLAAISIYVFIWPIAVYLWDSKDLRKYPAPSLWGIPSWAGWSNMWLAMVISKQKRSAYVQAAHEKYGAVIRIQPDHLSFVEGAAAKDIYGFQSKMLKGTFYETFSAPDSTGHVYKGMVPTNNREEHARKRKYVSNAFAQKNVVAFNPVLERAVADFVDRLPSIASKWTKRAPRPGFTDLYRCIHLLTLDLSAEMSFGENPGAVKTGDDVVDVLPFNGDPAFKINLINSYQEGSVYTSFFGPFPNMVHILKKHTSWHWNAKKNALYSQFIHLQVQKRIKRGPTANSRDLLSYFLEDKNGEPLNGLTYTEKRIEGSALFLAAIDLIATVLTNAMYLLLKNPACLEKLRQELDPVLKCSDIATYEQVRTLPYLRAVVDETLRDAPPIPAGLPRIVPEGGANIAGHFIKGGTTVSVPLISLHHNPAIFPDPHAFKPERWLGEDSHIMQEFCQPFSLGPRACIGRNLFYPQGLVIVATLVHRFDFELPSSDWTMDWKEPSNLHPVHLWVEIKKRV